MATKSEELIDLSETSFKYAAQSHTKTVLQIEKNRGLIDAIGEEKELKNYWGCKVSIMVGYGELNFSLSGTGKDLLALLNIIKDFGYKPHEGNKVENGKTASWEGRFVKGEEKILVQFSSTICRRVQVGTETVEQPIYEIQCGEEDADQTQDSETAQAQEEPSAGSSDASPQRSEV